MPKHFHTTYKIPTQSQQATHFYVFLKQDALQTLELNHDTISRLALVNIPISSNAQIVFGVGFGSRLIVAMLLTIANQYAILSGEGGPDIGCPNIITLPASIHQPASIAAMTIEKFSTKVK